MNKAQLRQVIREIIAQEIKVNQPRGSTGNNPLTFPKAPFKQGTIDALGELINNWAEGYHGEITPTGTYTLTDYSISDSDTPEENDLGIRGDDYLSFVEDLENIKNRGFYAFETTEEMNMNRPGELDKDYIGVYMHSVSYTEDKTSRFSGENYNEILIRMDFVDPDKSNPNPLSYYEYMKKKNPQNYGLPPNED